jgi:hypothetical protein
MIPSVISTQVQRGIEDFLRTTYPPAEPFFEDVLESLIAEENALFKGPFVTKKGSALFVILVFSFHKTPFLLPFTVLI